MFDCSFDKGLNLFQITYKELLSLSLCSTHRHEYWLMQLLLISRKCKWLNAHVLVSLTGIQNGGVHASITLMGVQNSALIAFHHYLWIENNDVHSCADSGG